MTKNPTCPKCGSALLAKNRSKDRLIFSCESRSEGEIFVQTKRCRIGDLAAKLANAVSLLSAVSRTAMSKEWVDERDEFLKARTEQ